MGTHISRVKSVDLDAWTDEQLQSILNWGNARANKYWEAKLAPGHVPSEAKIENFIRTKYELKRWVMDGPMPDPATLDAEGDDDVPLSVVKEKQNIERRESIRKASVGQTAAPQVDLIAADPVPAPAPPRASTAGPAAMQVPPKSGPAPPKATSTKDSLLGLDFLGTQPAAPQRPTSISGSGGQSRPDLKQSILSLYATAPRPQAPTVAQPASHAASGSMSGMPSPTGMTQTQGSLGGLNDAFTSLSFASSPSSKPAESDAFSSLGAFGASHPAPRSSGSALSGLSGGSFFDSKPAAPSHQPKQSIGSPSGWGSVTSPAPAPKPAAAPASSALGDLFDISAPSPPRAAPLAQPALAPIAPTTSTSVFNLSANPPKPTPAAAASATSTNPLNSIGALGANSLSNADVWGGNAWATPEAPKANAEPAKPSTATTKSDFGWASLASKPIVPGASGGFAPKVAADEEFGGWTSSTTTANASGTSKPAAGFGASEDLFSNVWQ